MNFWVIFIVLWLLVNAVVCYGLWRDSQRDEAERLALIERYHAHQQKALNEYRAALHAFDAGTIPLAEVEASYAHYLRVCGLHAEPES